jgi:hypothetical protein
MVELESKLCESQEITSLYVRRVYTEPGAFSSYHMCVCWILSLYSPHHGRVAVVVQLEGQLGLVQAQRPVGEAPPPHRARRGVQVDDGVSHGLGIPAPRRRL